MKEQGFTYRGSIPLDTLVGPEYDQAVARVSHFATSHIVIEPNRTNQYEHMQEINILVHDIHRLVAAHGKPRKRLLYAPEPSDPEASQVVGNEQWMEIASILPVEHDQGVHHMFKQAKIVRISAGKHEKMLEAVVYTQDMQTIHRPRLQTIQTSVSFIIQAPLAEDPYMESPRFHLWDRECGVVRPFSYIPNPRDDARYVASWHEVAAQLIQTIEM
jgi:hypothetical protein